jgi:BolA protein
MTVQETITDKLSQQLSPQHLSVENESHMHNVPAGSESHFRVVVVSEQFENLALLARHRAVNKVLADELAGPIHALALHTYTATEWDARGEQANASPDCHGGAGR